MVAIYRKVKNEFSCGVSLNWSTSFSHNPKTQSTSSRGKKYQILQEDNGMNCSVALGNKRLSFFKGYQGY